ncbi:phosphatase PAP2 family protein [Chitinimonas naiadis]
MRFSSIVGRVIPSGRPTLQVMGDIGIAPSSLAWLDVFPSHSQAAFSLKRAWSWMLALAVGLVLLFTFTRLDYLLADRYYLSPGHFSGAGNWWLETFSHVLVKRAGLFILLLVWLRVLCGRFVPAWAPNQRRWLAVALAMSLAPATVSLLKPLSGVQCPWDLQRYGGLAWDHISWLTQQVGVRRGGCFPAGHATSGFGFFGLVLLFLGRSPRKAAITGAVVLVAGLLLGWGQQMRGAHFFSHTLWSAWVCWAVCLAVYGALGMHRPNRE